MTPRNEDSLYRELTAADLATFWSQIKKRNQGYFFENANLVANKCNVRILLPALPKYLNKAVDAIAKLKELLKNRNASIARTLKRAR